MSDEVRDWVGFWDTPHSIYVNARHFDVHYREIAERMVALLPKPQARALDYGCGEAFHADLVAAAAGELQLCDAASTVRAKLGRRFARNGNIKVLAPAEVEQSPDASLDLVMANSLTQYVSPGELDRLLALWRRLLAPDGTLVIGDVIPPDCGVVDDVLALLRYGARHGFAVAAGVGVLRMAISPYRRVRARLGITCYGEGEFLAKLSTAGFAAERLAFNLEHNPARMTFRARPA